MTPVNRPDSDRKNQDSNSTQNQAGRQDDRNAEGTKAHGRDGSQAEQKDAQGTRGAPGQQGKHAQGADDKTCATNESDKQRSAQDKSAPAQGQSTKR